MWNKLNKKRLFLELSIQTFYYLLKNIFLWKEKELSYQKQLLFFTKLRT